MCDANISALPPVNPVRSFNFSSAIVCRPQSLTSNTSAHMSSTGTEPAFHNTMTRTLNVELIIRGLTAKCTIREVTPGSHFQLSGFTSESIIHEGNSEVQVGVVNLTDGQHVLAVCKIARNDLSNLRHEAALYDDSRYLRTLQGFKVPLFFGYFECEVGQGPVTTPMGCMILEHCGQPMSSAVMLQTKMMHVFLGPFFLVHVDEE